MADNKGTKVIAPIVTPSTADTFPTHLNNLGKGGYKTVQSIADRNAIPMERREEAMKCFVIADKTEYQLIGGIDNAFWEIFAIGAGGSTSASSLDYSPTGELIGTNVQTALDELESRKANVKDIYTKAETQALVDGTAIDYNNLENLPDLDQLHEHTNKPTLDKFTESQGDLVWNGRTLGNMIADMYDSDKDGLVDIAKTLEGLNVSTSLLNHTAGLTGNIQQQISALSSGTVFKGEFNTYAEMVTTLISPEKGYWVFIIEDENYSNAKTQYYHDGTEWIYGGGSSQTPSATDTLKGSIMLKGALENPNGSAENPLLSETGVVEGLYKSANIIVGKDGRITHAEEGSTAFINDDITNEVETWSSQKISDSLFGKSPTNHSHAQLHDANTLGDVKLDVKTKSDKRVITYNAITGQAEWQDSAGGKVYVGSKVITGDYRLVSGSYINLFIDEVAKTITINGLPSGSGGVGGVPTLTEITHTLMVSAGSTEKISLDTAFNKYDLRTLEAKSENEETISVNIYDQSEGGRKVYYSNKEKFIYDIVNVPIHDKDDSQKVHLEVSNHSVTDATVSLTINITNLI